MSHWQEIWKWDDAQKRLDPYRVSPQAGSDNGNVRVDGVVNRGVEEIALVSQNAQLRRMYDREYEECQNWRRLYEAKSIECAKAQSKLETAERWIASIARQILTSEMDEEDELAADYEGAYNSIVEEARLEVARLQKRVDELEVR